MTGICFATAGLPCLTSLEQRAQRQRVARRVCLFVVVEVDERRRGVRRQIADRRDPTCEPRARVRAGVGADGSVEADLEDRPGQHERRLAAAQVVNAQRRTALAQ